MATTQNKYQDLHPNLRHSFFQYSKGFNVSYDQLCNDKYLGSGTVKQSIPRRIISWYKRKWNGE